MRRSSTGRLGMLETILEFADERLATLSDLAALRRRHAEYFLAIAEASGTDENGPADGGSVDLESVRSEIENIRVALEWASDSDPVLGVGLIVAIARYWIPNAPAEGQRWLESMLERQPGFSVAEGEVSAHAGWPHLHSGRLHRRGQAPCRKPRRISAHRRRRARLVRPLSGWRSRRWSGDWTNAKLMAKESLDISRKHGSRRGEAEALYALGDVAYGEGHHDEAPQLLEESARIAGEVGSPGGRSVRSIMRPSTPLSLGRLIDAQRYIQDGMTLARSINDRQSTVWFLGLAAWLGAIEGLAERAGILWGAIEADERRSRIGQWEGARDVLPRQARDRCRPRL